MTEIIGTDQISVIGPHRVKHGDLMEGIDDLMQGDKVDIFYSDPPWGDGNLKYWQTINSKMNGVPYKTINFDEFLNAVFSCMVKYCVGISFIEYGIRWENKIRELATQFNLSHNGIIDIKYRGGSKFLPLHLHILSKDELTLPVGYADLVQGTTGMGTLRAAVTPFAKAGFKILDPCCGKGYTAQIALETGMVFRGNEINEKRLAETIKRLLKNR